MDAVAAVDKHYLSRGVREDISWASLLKKQELVL